jgi:hypothetical protein
MTRRLRVLYVLAIRMTPRRRHYFPAFVAGFVVRSFLGRDDDLDLSTEVEQPTGKPLPSYD